MITKTCSKCNNTKPINSFATRNKEKGWYNPWCKDCLREYDHLRYIHNKEKHNERGKYNRNQKRLQNWRHLINYFQNHPCVDCGEQDPIVLEFDHLKDKEFNISSKIPFCNWETLLKEIEKCEVRCANCHRRKTAQEQGWYKKITFGRTRL